MTSGSQPFGYAERRVDVRAASIGNGDITAAPTDTRPGGKPSGNGYRRSHPPFPHLPIPRQPLYATTVPEMCFATEDDALAADFRAPRRKPRQKLLDAAQ